MNKSSVYVVILNYNHLEDLKETVESFLVQDYPNLHIVVSDNGSTDDSIKWLKNNHPNIILLENKSNSGWADGNNIGIQYALKQNVDYILLANNDLSFDEPTIITSLLKAYDEIPKLGVIGPSQNSYYNKSKIVNQGWIMYPKVKQVFNKFRLLNNPIGISEKYRIIDNVSGSFMIIKRQIFEEIGLIDSKLFLYAEDTDFSIRAWSKGWISAVNKEITIYHKVSATSGINSPLKIYYMTRNLIYLIRKHKESQSSHNFFIIKYYLDLIKQFIRISINAEYTGSRWYKLKALVIGFFHGAVIKRMNQYY